MACDPEHKARSLSTMLAIAVDEGTQWSEDDFGVLLAHQLSSPLRADLIEENPNVSDTIQAIEAMGRQPPLTFGELLLQQNPPIKLLKLVKDFAKKQRNAADPFIPKEVATCLYFTALAQAIVQYSQRISHLNDEQLAEGFDWVALQEWTGPSIRSLCELAASRLSSP